MSVGVPLVPLRRYVTSIKDGTHGTHRRVVDGVPLLSAKNIQDGTVVMGLEESRITPDEYFGIHRSGYLAPGDVLLTIVGSIGRAAIYDGEAKVAFQRSVASLRPAEHCDARFLFYCLCSTLVQEQLAAASHQSAQSGVYLGDLATVTVPLLPLAAQRAIADYLDRETARIDALIAGKRRMVELSEERDQTELSRLVFPTDCPMAHLRYFASVQGGITVDSGRDAGTDAVIRPYLRVANVQAGRLDLTEVTQITVPLALAARSTLRKNDVLMTEGGDIDKLGRGTVWDSQLEDCLHQNHIFAVRPDPRHLDSWYLALITQSTHARAYFESTGVQATNLASTSSSKILDLPVPVLPLHVQREIVADWRQRSALTVGLRSALGVQIGLLQERRQALTTAAVTGQLDIPKAA